VTLTDRSSATSQGIDHSEFGVAGLLAVAGAFVLFESSRIDETLAGSNPIGPKFVPVVVGVLLVVIAVLLAVDIARGGRGESEIGEDVDLSKGTDWPTLIALIAVFGATAQLIPMIGFPAAGMVLFFGTSRILGSRRLWLDVLVSVAVPLVAFLLFTRGLGVYLPAGPN